MRKTDILLTLLGQIRRAQPIVKGSTVDSIDNRLPILSIRIPIGKATKAAPRGNKAPAHDSSSFEYSKSKFEVRFPAAS